MRIKGKLLELDEPAVMGILNITPDSFYGESRVTEEKEIVHRAGQMLKEGALFLDIGGYSTRPGAGDVPVEEEKNRVIPAIEAILREYPGTYISIDTFRSEVAEAAIAAGACLINDVSGGTLDDRMYAVAAALETPYILMHMRGDPTTMKDLTTYQDLIPDIVKDLSEKVQRAVRAGIHDIIIDPGFGFAKTIEQNFRILENLEYFKVLGRPLLAGVSRKSMIYRTLDIPPDEALTGTIVLNTIALMNGARILRVHDVREAMETVNLYKATYR